MPPAAKLLAVFFLAMLELWAAVPAGIALGAPRGKLVIWCSLGATLWTALFSAALALGVAL